MERISGAELLHHIASYDRLDPRSPDMIPAHLLDGLRRYFEDGIVPGDFLLGVLTNDLGRAVAHADEISVWAIPALAAWLFNNPPMSAWGSLDKVTAYVRKLEATRKDNATLARAMGLAPDRQVEDEPAPVDDEITFHRPDPLEIELQD